MDATIEKFYTNSEKDKNYIEHYSLEHSKRHDEIVKRFKLDEIKNETLLNVGGGLGLLESRLDKSNKFVIADGAELPIYERLCEFTHIKIDANKEFYIKERGYDNFYAGFLLECIEHLENPYNCLIEMRKIVKENHYIYISIPDISVTHVTPYPTLIYPPANFIIFLEQIALLVEDYFFFENGFKTHIFKCRNAPMKEARYLPIFQKNEPKFIGKTPIEIANT